MSTLAERVKAKRARRPIYVTCMRIAIVGTGEERLAWVASHPIDARLMRERGWRNGDEASAEFKKSRNVKFHRLAHAIGHLLVDNVESFRGVPAHDALKQVQRESGVCCEQQMIDMGTIKFGEISVPVGKVPVTVARSIAFDSMSEDEFHEFFNGIVDYIDRNYSMAMTEDVRAEYALMVSGEKH